MPPLSYRTFPSRAHTPLYRPLFLCPSSIPPPSLTPILGQESDSTSSMALSALRHCTVSFACCPPANRDWWEGTNRFEMWPSSGAHRTRPRSLTSLSTLLLLPEEERARDARVKENRDKTDAEGFTAKQGSYELKRTPVNSEAAAHFIFQISY